jgi:hypothetical protein
MPNMSEPKDEDDPNVVPRFPTIEERAAIFDEEQKAMAEAQPAASMADFEPNTEFAAEPPTTEDDFTEKLSTEDDFAVRSTQPSVPPVQCVVVKVQNLFFLLPEAQLQNFYAVANVLEPLIAHPRGNQLDFKTPEFTRCHPDSRQVDTTIIVNPKLHES